nr:MAG TPA_asm: hypothetical protein [Bacteriophage sp.]
MIIDYDHNPNIDGEKRLQSLKESVQRALDEVSNTDTKETTVNEIKNFYTNNTTIVQGDGSSPIPEDEIASLLNNLFND